MGAGYSHRCNKCGYSVSTSGPWEFYRDNKGERRHYGHPVPFSDEARKRGIHGLYGSYTALTATRRLTVSWFSSRNLLRTAFRYGSAGVNQQTSSTRKVR